MKKTIKTLDHFTVQYVFNGLILKTYNTDSSYAELVFPTTYKLTKYLLKKVKKIK